MPIDGGAHKQQQLMSYCSGDRKSKVRVPAQVGSDEPLFPRLHTAEGLGTSVSSMSINPIYEDSTLMTYVPPRVPNSYYYPPGAGGEFSTYDSGET